MVDQTEHDDFNDDFQDDNMESDTDMATDDQSDEWADEEYTDDEGEASEDPAPKKKKSKLSNLVIIGVVVVAAVGFFLLKGSGDSSTATPTEEATAETAATTGDATAQPPTDGAAAQQETPQKEGDTTTSAKADAKPDDSKGGGLMMDDNPEKSVSVVDVDETAKPPQDQPEDQAAKDGTPQDKTAAAPTENQGTTAAPKGDAAPTPADFPTVDKILKPEADKPVEKADDTANDKGTAPVVPPVDKAAEPTASASVDSEAIKKTEAYQSLASQLSDEQAKVAELQKRLDDQEKASANNSAADLDALKAKIADLESKLEAKSHEAPVPLKETTRGSNDNTDDVAEAPHRVVHTAQKAVAKVAKKTSPILRQNWTLKAATPSRATVAATGSGDLKTLHVGDVFAPIGRVTAIENGPTGWVVKGTQGRISQ